MNYCIHHFIPGTTRRVVRIESINELKFISKNWHSLSDLLSYQNDQQTITLVIIDNYKSFFLAKEIDWFPLLARLFNRIATKHKTLTQRPNNKINLNFKTRDNHSPKPKQYQHKHNHNVPPTVNNHHQTIPTLSTLLQFQQFHTQHTQQNTIPYQFNQFRHQTHSRSTTSRSSRGPKCVNHTWPININTTLHFVRIARHPIRILWQQWTTQLTFLSRKNLLFDFWISYSTG